MKKVIENLGVLYKAAKHSLMFSWRTDRKLVILRLALALVLTLLSYAAIYSQGLLINVVQRAITNFTGGSFYTEFMKSGLLWPVLLTLLVLLAIRNFSSYSNMQRSIFREILRFANQRELQEHRATLDIATVRSKEFDDLERRISDLPQGWATKITFSESILESVTTLTSIVIFGSSLVWYNPYYALVILLCSIPKVLVEFKVTSDWWNLSIELTPTHKQLNVLERPYRGFITFVQALMFTQMVPLRQKIDETTQHIMNKKTEIRRRAAKNRLWVNSLTTIGLIGIMAHASWDVISLSGQIGTLTIILGTARSFQGDVENLINQSSEHWNSAKGIILIEEEFFKITTSLPTEYPVVPPAGITPEIVFENVSFRYPNTEKMVLDNMSFRVKPGSKVAIVGASGHGKTTIQALMMRAYDPTMGKVTANGINLRNIHPNEWSKIASSLTQDFVVLERLVGEEIASSRMDQPIDIEAVKKSARFANIHTVIESDPDGYDSQIGTDHGGREFSGGEKQRLALARVHYRDARILILDEPDARLDPISAEKVMDNIFAMTGVTVVIITHHIGRAEKCDQVIVVEEGKVVEQGSHQELVALNGTYVKMLEEDQKKVGSRLGPIS